MTDILAQCNETERLAALLRYEVLDTPPEPLLDDITKLAAQICNAPISLISLVDDQRQWFKAKLGLEVCETPRELAFCAHALSTPNEVLVVSNATEDPRFSGNSLVTGEPHIRFYAGAPLVTSDNYVLGTLCIIDRQPRIIDRKQLDVLKKLSRQVVALLEAKRNFRLLQEAAHDLEQQRRETQLIFDHVPAEVLYKDANNRLLRVNKVVTESLGLNHSEIEGRLATEFYSTRGEKYHVEDLEVIRSGKPMLGILEQYNADSGEMRWTSTDKIPIANEQGVVDKVLVVATDITDLMDTEQSLRESQAQLSLLNEQLEERVQQKTAELRASRAQYEDLYQNAPDMHVSIEPKDGRVLQCNQTLLLETGYRRDEIIGQPVFKLYHPSCLDEVRIAMHAFRTTGSVHNHELTLSRKDGSPIEVSLNVSSVRDRQGKIIASRSVWRDITEKKRLADEASNLMHQLAHLSRVATMNEMATGISHELNQPLHAIKNYAQGTMIRLKKQSLDQTSLPQIFEDIVANADRAAELIISFRSLIKPSERSVRYAAPADLANRVTKLVSHELQHHGFRLEIDITGNLPAIICDSVQIKQVLINLILNAAEAMAASTPKHNEIVLALEPTARQTVKFSVIDQGPGLTDVDVDRMFEAFYTTKSTGLGMGLPICRTIVEAHGGKLRASVNDRDGLTMSFEIAASNENAKNTVF